MINEKGYELLMLYIDRQSVKTDIERLCKKLENIEKQIEEMEKANGKNEIKEALKKHRIIE